MIEKSDCLPVGTITKTHGVEGELTLRLFDGIDADIIDPDYFFLELEGGLVPFYVVSLRDRGDGSLLVGFEHVLNESVARRYLEAPVWMANEDYTPGMEEDGSMHSGLLVGYLVEDQVHGTLGRIVELRDPERNPLFVIEGAHGEILIPVADEFFTGLNAEKKILYVSTPEGLVDLNET